MAMTLTEKRQRAAERKASAERLERVMVATADERSRFNQAIRNGAVVNLPTFHGTALVGSVNAQWEYHCPKENGSFGMSYAGCNNGVWADLLNQAGVARHPLFRG